MIFWFYNCITMYVIFIIFCVCLVISQKCIDEVVSQAPLQSLLTKFVVTPSKVNFNSLMSPSKMCFLKFHPWNDMEEFYIIYILWGSRLVQIKKSSLPHLRVVLVVTVYANVLYTLRMIVLHELRLRHGRRINYSL